MVSDLAFYPLVFVVLVWLWIMLHYAWPSARSIAYHRLAKPITLPRQRWRDSRPFAGLTHKPQCAACEQASQAPVASPPSAAPLRLTSTRGRRRHIDTALHFCPNATCDYQGWAGLDNIRANGHPSGGLWRQLHCRACEGYFLETHGTLFHGKRVAHELLVWAIGALAEGLGIRAVARVFAVDPNTVLEWLVEAADHLQAFSRHFLHDVHVNQVQMDELFALLSAVKADEVSEAEAIQRLSRSPHWVWVAMDPVSKLLLTMDVGNRTLAMAQRVVHQVVHVLAPDCAPLFLTDGFKEYMTAVLTHYGEWVQPPRRQATGPVPKPRWMPVPELRYAQVVKRYRRKRVVGVYHRVVFGTLAAVKQVLATTGWHINTAFIERANLSIRQHVAAVGRRVTTLCKHEAGLRQQLALYGVYYNFCLPHASLRQPLLQPDLTNGNGSGKRWQPQTPAMAAGLTDHIWTLREVLLFHVPPRPQPQTL